MKPTAASAKKVLATTPSGGDKGPERKGSYTKTTTSRITNVGPKPTRR